MSLTKDRELADLLYNSYGDLSLLLADLTSLSELQAQHAVAVQNHDHDKTGHDSHATAPTEAQKKTDSRTAKNRGIAAASGANHQAVDSKPYRRRHHH